MPKFDFRSPRLFVEAALAAGQTVALERSQSNYLGNVLRLSAGGTILVFNGRDGEWQASIAGRKRPDSLAIVARTRPQDRLPDLAYVFAPLKHARLDYMVQKAVEMGASSLQPVLTRFTQVARVNGERMRANVIEAAEQCGILSIAALAGVSETTVRGVLTGRGGTRVGPEKRALVEEAARAAGWKPLPRASGPAPHWRRSGLEDLFATAATGRFLVRKRGKTMAGRPVPLGGEWPGTRLLGRNALARSQWGWLPIAGGDVHPHLERHWVKTRMEHARIPEILSEEVLGHRVPGVSGRYRHVSPEMRADLAAAQTKAWEAALDARLAMSPYSPVAVLRELLGDRAEARKLRILPRLTPEQPEGVPVIGTGTPDDLGGRYWDRTSDLFGVNEGGSAEIQ